MFIVFYTHIKLSILLPYWATKLYHLYKKPKLIYLVGKTQKAQQNPLKAHCYMASPKTRYNTAPLKVRYNTAPLKARYDMTPLKPVAT